MKVTTTYLHMFGRPQRIVPPPREGLAVVHAKTPTVAHYRFLYDARQELRLDRRKRAGEAPLLEELHARGSCSRFIRRHCAQEGAAFLPAQTLWRPRLSRT